jgi:16S rRNA processing protein RimM
MEHDLIEIARVTGPKGLKGKMWITPYGDSFERFRHYSHLRIGKQGEPRKVLSLFRHKGKYLASLEGITDIEQVEDIRGESLYISREQLEPLGEDEYYWHDLIGMTVVDMEGRELGTVVKIFSTGSNDVYVVDPVKQYYIPATTDVIREICPEKKTIVIEAELLEDILD